MNNECIITMNGTGLNLCWTTCCPMCFYLIVVYYSFCGSLAQIVANPEYHLVHCPLTGLTCARCEFAYFQLNCFTNPECQFVKCLLNNSCGVIPDQSLGPS